MAYLSPEQANGEALDGRSDLFAVGAILWELLTGRTLFDGSPRETVAKVMFGTIPRPSSIRPEIPADLEAVAMRLLEREKSARYAQAALAIDDLAKCADARRHGRLDLVRLLAARFPEAIAARASESQRGHSPPRANAGPADRVTVRNENADAREREQQRGSPVSPSEAEASLSVRPSGGRVRWRWSAVTIAGVAAGMVAVLMASHRNGSPAAPTAITSSPQAAAEGSGDGRASKRPAPTITVVTEPPGAILRIDGAARGRAPLTLPVDSGAGCLSRRSTRASSRRSRPLPRSARLRRSRSACRLARPRSRRSRAYLTSRSRDSCAEAGRTSGRRHRQELRAKAAAEAVATTRTT